MGLTPKPDYHQDKGEMGTVFIWDDYLIMSNFSLVPLPRRRSPRKYRLRRATVPGWVLGLTSEET